jgi:hypothetical protein
MLIKKLLDNRLVTVAAGAAIVGMVGAGAGWSAAAITSADIANNTVRSADVKDGTLKVKDLNAKTVTQLKGQTGATGPQGPAGVAGPSTAATYVGPNWQIVDRNVEENGAAYLRTGPGTAPVGVGSLGLRTGGGGVDKAAFGNQVDFANVTLASLNTLKYSIYTTGENVANGADNGPSLSMELDTSGPGAPVNFTTMVWVPQNLTANAWTEQDASTGARFFLTGAAGTSSGCNQVTYCTLAQVKTAFPSASLLTVQFTKGRDVEFSGAVDKLVINTKTFDFEPFGVKETTS